MKHFFKLTCVAAAFTACLFILPFFNKEANAGHKPNSKVPSASQFNIALNSQPGSN